MSSCAAAISVPVEARSTSARPSAPSRVASVCIVEHAAHGGGEAGRVVGDQQVTAGGRAQALGAERCGHHRAPQGQRLEHLAAHAGAEADRRHHDLRAREPGPDVVDRTDARGRATGRSG